MTKLPWEQLEYTALNILQEYDKSARYTVGSGRFHDADIRGETFLIECKWRNTELPILSVQHWHKINQEAHRLHKIPILYLGTPYKACCVVDYDLATEVGICTTNINKARTYNSTTTLREFWDKYQTGMVGYSVTLAYDFDLTYRCAVIGRLTDFLYEFYHSPNTNRYS